MEQFGFQEKRETFDPEQLCDHTLQSELINKLKDKFPETIQKNLDNLNERKREVEIIDSEFYDNDMLDAIRQFGVDVSVIQEKIPGGETFQIPVKEGFDFTLPDEYAYKGGAARALLYRALGIDEEAEPRDMDVVRIAEEPWEGCDDFIADKLMHDDYMQGYGVEVIEDKDEYFPTRDLTINEILATEDEISITKQGLADTIRHILRVTDYEVEKAREKFDEEVPYKLMSKMVRLHSEAFARYGDGKAFSIDENQKYEYERSMIPSFFIALHLDRAFEQGQEVAERYVEYLKELGQLPDEIQTPRELVFYLNEDLLEGPFYYRYAPVSQYEIENDWEKRNPSYEINTEEELEDEEN